ncbi:MAG: hypothetical protein AAF723_08205, partial [Pseudomonadota bacterium]
MPVLFHIGETHIAALPLQEDKGGGADTGPFISLDQGATDRHGNLTQDAAKLFATLAEDLPEKLDEAIIILPARQVRCRCLSVEVPVNGGVGQHHAEAALTALKSETDHPGEVVLYRQPSGYTLDGVSGIDDPVGRFGRLLSAEAVVMTVSMRFLMSIEAALTEAGLSLRDVITPHAALPASHLQRGEGAALIHIGHGETTISISRHAHIIGAGSIPLGVRHVVGDVMKMCDQTSGEARHLVHRSLSASWETSDLVTKVVQARVEEIVEDVAHVIKSSNHGESRVILSGALASFPLVREKLQADLGPLFDVEAVGSNQTISDQECLLLGAARVLQGSYGV